MAGTHPNDSSAAGAGEPEVAADAASEPVSPPVDERTAAFEAEVARLKDERLRALAEIENTRRRAQRDREEAAQYAIGGFARDLLAVADSLERALSTIDPGQRAADPALDALASGIELTQRQLLGVFERHGVKPMAADGAAFDPHRHEAMFEIPNESVPHGTIVQVLEQGYTLHDRTLRPARVGLTRGGPKRPPAAVEEPAAPPSGDPYQKSAAGNGPGSRVDETL
jgi:molecular chaperone GrpE